MNEHGEHGDDFQELMQRLHDGSEEAAYELVAKYAEPLLRAVRRGLQNNPPLRAQFDSADFAQMAWKSFFRKRQEWQDVETPEQLLSFLISIARNKLSHERRQLGADKRGGGHQIRIVGLTEQLVEGLPDHRTTPTELMVSQEELDRVLGRHPIEHRAMFHLHRAGHDSKEIAKIFDLSAGHVRRILGSIFGEFLAEKRPRAS